MKKTFKVVMLPTEKASKIVLNLTNNILSYSEEVEQQFVRYGEQAQHLYILSDEQPKEGDWMIVYNPILGYNHSIIKVEDIKQVVKGNGFQKYNQKIIATTDELESIPQISKESLMEYSEKFDKISKISGLKLEENSKFLKLIF